MKYKVGIPKGLFFYDYFFLFNTFLNELGVEVIISNKSNKKILNDGVLVAVDHACLPVKIFHGHIMDLKDRVDYLLIPRFKSVNKKEYECPKIIGIPEMIKNSISDLPKIIEPTIDLSKSKFSIINTLINIGKHFTKDIVKINKAYNKALNEHYRKKKELKNNIFTIDFTSRLNSNNNNDINILVLGHSYNLFDSYISMNLIEKLIRQKVNIILSDMIDENKINDISQNQNKKIFWSLGNKTIGSAYSVIDENNVDGIIYISSFGCGIDSILIDLIQRKSFKNNMPFTLLTIDEHTGEAGINTRIEAFLDMLRWRKKDEDNISTYG